MTARQVPIGRDAELAVLDRALDALDVDGRSAVVQVAGEPGIGKSRMLSELAGRADARGHLVLSGRSAEFDVGVPFGLFASAFDDFLTSRDPSELATLDPGTYPELAIVFPAFVPLAAGGSPSVHAERYRTHRAVRALIEMLARPRPMVVTLDDLHWADPASVEVLIHLLAHVPAAPVLIGLAFRPTEVPARLGRALASAVRDGTSRRLDLAALNPAEADALVGSRVSGPHREALYRESGGNPFYLEQLLRAIPLSPTPLRTLNDGDAVPPLVTAALASELATLSVSARRLLEAAAVIGDPFDDELAAAVALLQEGEAHACLDDLLVRDLIRALPSPRRFRFRHPIVRHAVYEATGTGWRVGAHGRAAEALGARGVSASVLAQHVERSARLGDRAAVDVLVEAANAAELRSPSTSARWCQSALRLLPEGPEHQAQRLDLLIRMAIASGTAGEFDQSHEALCQVLAVLPAGAKGRVGLVAFCAAMERLTGRSDEARQRLAEALDQVDDHASSDAVELKLELAVDAFVACDFTGTLHWSQEALVGARALGRPDLEAPAAAVSAIADQDRVGPFDERVDRAREIVDGLTDEQLAARLDAATWLAYAEVFGERYQDAVRHAERGINIARATGRGQFVPQTTIAHLYGLLWSGRLAEAGEVAEAAVEVFRLSEDSALAEALCCRSFVRAAQGDLAAAIADGEESIEVHRQRRGVPLLGAASGIFLGSYYVEAGAPERGRDIVLTMAGGKELAFAERKGRFAALEVLTQAELDLGHIDAAEAWAHRADAMKGFGRFPIESAPATRARAAVLLARGDARAAAEVALASAEACARLKSPIEAGRSRTLAGRALAQSGHRDRAVAELERAEVELEGCGASGYGGQAAAELRRLGRRQPRRSGRGEGTHALTARELDIANLVSEGRTNRDIAAACYLSEKTVERHVSHIFDKLGVRSRASIAALIGREKGRSRGASSGGVTGSN